MSFNASVLGIGEVLVKNLPCCLSALRNINYSPFLYTSRIAACTRPYRKSYSDSKRSYSELHRNISYTRTEQVGSVQTAWQVFHWSFFDLGDWCVVAQVNLLELFEHNCLENMYYSCFWWHEVATVLYID